jgi:hypothetical protein
MCGGRAIALEMCDSQVREVRPFVSGQKASCCAPLANKPVMVVEGIPACRV